MDSLTDEVRCDADLPFAENRALGAAAVDLSGVQVGQPVPEAADQRPQLGLRFIVQKERPCVAEIEKSLVCWDWRRGIARIAGPVLLSMEYLKKMI